jgi:hypothetical protein
VLRGHRRSEPSQHLNDANEQRAAASAGGSGGQAAAQDDVDDRSALRRAAAGDAIETGLVRGRETAGAFGDVERDRRARPIELVAKAGRAALRKKAGGDSLELEGETITVELLSVQASRAGEERGGSGGSGDGSEVCMPAD